jgi:hypothetical protein
MTTLTLSEIQDSDFTHLDTMSTHLIDLAGRRTTMDKIAAQSAGLPWDGTGKNGLDAVMAQHVGRAGADAAAMTTTAGIAKQASETLSGSRQLMLEAVDGAKGFDFDVADDFTATDLNPLRAKYLPNLAAGVTEDLQAQAAAFGDQRQAFAAAIHSSLEDSNGPLDHDPGGWYEDKNGEWWPTYNQAWCSNLGPAWRGTDDCWSYGTAGFRTGGGDWNPDDPGWYPWNPNGVPRGPEPPEKGSIGIPIGTAGAQTPLERGLGFRTGGGPAQPPNGIVKCWENDYNGFTCVERLPDGSIYTWPNAPVDIGGVWPDAARAGEGHATPMGNIIHVTPDDRLSGYRQTPHNTIHTTPYPGDLMDRDRENPLPTPPGHPSPGGAWRDVRTPYGDNFSEHGRLEHCTPDRQVEDVARASLGLAGIASGNAILGIVGSTLGVESGLKDLMKCEPPGGIH